MSTKLVITEKPSQAQAYAAVIGAKSRKDGYLEGNDYIVSWCFGHLLELAQPQEYDQKYAKWKYSDLPIIPDKFKHIPAKDKIKQLKMLKELMNRADVECVINAADAGREGESIFRHVYEYAKCKKPIKRLWISSMEDSAIKAGFANLKDGAEYDNLCNAAKCREQADWVVGINATRLMSVNYNTTLNCGRVQSPTLAMLVKREEEIANFVKEPFCTPTLDLSDFLASGERLKDKAEADKVAEDFKGKSVTITDVERVTKSVAPPKLFDLTTLQQDANRICGFTAQQTLDYAQNLYEKKILTYPRTDSKFITEDMRETVIKILGETDFTPDIDRICGKVSDHHAILPTLESKTANLTAIPSGEMKIYELVKKRLIAAVSPKHVYEAVTVTLDCGGNVFKTRGKTIIEIGWKANSDADESGETKENKESNDNDADKELPELSKGQTFDSFSVAVKEGFSKPKPRHTEASILAAMETAGAEDFKEIDGEVERKGIGTPATRASIIEKLIKTGFAERVKKNLLPTEKGKNLIKILPDSLTSAKLTANWEQKLLEVQRGELSAAEFMANIEYFIKSIVVENSKPNPDFAKLFPQDKVKGNANGNAPIIGLCPRCNGKVREGESGFFCDNADTCGFKLWKGSKFWTVKKKPLTAEIVRVLLKDGRVALTGLYSEKTSKNYDAIISFDDNKEGFVNFKMTFGSKK